jgi:hypothetical protein
MSGELQVENEANSALHRAELALLGDLCREKRGSGSLEPYNDSPSRQRGHAPSFSRASVDDDDATPGEDLLLRHRSSVSLLRSKRA